VLIETVILLQLVTEQISSTDSSDEDEQKQQQRRQQQRRQGDDELATTTPEGDMNVSERVVFPLDTRQDCNTDIVDDTANRTAERPLASLPPPARRTPRKSLEFEGKVACKER